MQSTTTLSHKNGKPKASSQTSTTANKENTNTHNNNTSTTPNKSTNKDSGKLFPSPASSASGVPICPTFHLSPASSLQEWQEYTETQLDALIISAEQALNSQYAHQSEGRLDGEEDDPPLFLTRREEADLEAVVLNYHQLTNRCQQEIQQVQKTIPTHKQHLLNTTVDEEKENEQDTTDHTNISSTEYTSPSHPPTSSNGHLLSPPLYYLHDRQRATIQRLTETNEEQQRLIELLQQKVNDLTIQLETMTPIYNQAINAAQMKTQQQQESESNYTATKDAEYDVLTQLYLDTQQQLHDAQVQLRDRTQQLHVLTEQLTLLQSEMDLINELYSKQQEEYRVLKQQQEQQSRLYKLSQEQVGELQVNCQQMQQCVENQDWKQSNNSSSSSSSKLGDRESTGNKISWVLLLFCMVFCLLIDKWMKIQYKQYPARYFHTV